MIQSKTYTSHSAQETKEIARAIASELAKIPPIRTGALVVALTGNLGGGKTTFTQGFVEALGITDSVLSPTFVLMNIYPIPDNVEVRSPNVGFQNLVHIDAYRLEDPVQLHAVGWKDIIQSTDNIVLVEWADNVRALLPKDFITISFEWINEHTRKIHVKI